MPTSPRLYADSDCGPLGNEFQAGFSRIARALGIHTQLELADILGIRQSSISDAKRRGVIPGEWGLKLYREHRLNPRWIYDGLPPMFLGAAGRTPGRAPMRDAQSFLHKYPEEFLTTITVEDTAMEPGVPRKSLVGIDRRDTTLTPGALMGIHLPVEGLCVRRIEKAPSGRKAMILANNPSVPPQCLALDDCRERLAGRAVWVLALT